MRKLIILFILFSIIFGFSTTIFAARPVIVNASGAEVIDEVIQHQKKAKIIFSTWESFGYPETTYKTITFMNGYECTGTSISYIDNGEDSFYYYRLKVTNYHYRTW